MTMDPVCGTKVDERMNEFETKFAGKRYFFCSDECRAEFEDHPEDYLEVVAA
jgi:YHS domain-containing protein